MTFINVHGGYELGTVAEKVAYWCVEHFEIEPKVINISITHRYDNCWGICGEGEKPGTYDMTVVAGQSLRDFVATIAHEMVHIRQWETQKWRGDGEREAERLQYRLTDRMWKTNVI